jgi:hypothetical protein
MLFIEPRGPWEIGYNESFNGKLRDELLNREIFCTLWEAKVIVKRWRRESTIGFVHTALWDTDRRHRRHLNGFAWIDQFESQGCANSEGGSHAFRRFGGGPAATAIISRSSPAPISSR